MWGRALRNDQMLHHAHFPSRQHPIITRSAARPSAARLAHLLPPFPSSANMLNATVYEYAILASVLVTLMGGIAYTTPPYNPGPSAASVNPGHHHPDALWDRPVLLAPALALFGIYVYSAQNPRITGWFLVLLPVSIIFDICYCGVWGMCSCRPHPCRAAAIRSLLCAQAQASPTSTSTRQRRWVVT